MPPSDHTDAAFFEDFEPPRQRGERITLLELLGILLVIATIVGVALPNVF
jgi:hypothetical protein